jgi:amino acid transporter
MWLAELVATGHDVRWLIIPGTSFVFVYYLLWDSRRYFRERWFWWSLVGLVVLGAVFWIAVIASGVHLPLIGYWALFVLEDYALLLGFGWLEYFFLQRADAEHVV